MKPVLLRQRISEFESLKTPPENIYYIGNTNLLDAPKVSIVGTRRPYAYTKKWTYELARKLKCAGVNVVSGAAMGVDAIAHDGAFPKTVAVMGNGLNIIYPQVNKNLIQKMQNESLVLSEYEPDSRATRYTFVERNRLVVALGEVLVIAQADLKSGSMRSAEIALEQGKPIYVFPHRLGESEGTNYLLAKGLAKPLYDLDAFVAEFGDSELQSDPFMNFCLQSPTLEEALLQYGEQVHEYELEGYITIENGYLKVLE